MKCTSFFLGTQLTEHLIGVRGVQIKEELESARSLHRDVQQSVSRIQKSASSVDAQPKVARQGAACQDEEFDDQGASIVTSDRANAMARSRYVLRCVSE